MAAGQPLLLLLLAYSLLKRRRDVSAAQAERRAEIRRRVRHRHCFLQRQRRMLMMLIAASRPCGARTRVWTSIERTDWWERVVMREFQPRDWLEKFRMSRDTFLYLCGQLRPRLERQDTNFRPALPVEKRLAVALWRLATNVEYRTISALFGVGSSTVCKCLRDVCHALVSVLRPLYLRRPGQQQLEEAARLFYARWGFPHCVGVLDSLHIAVIAPPTNTDAYCNRAHWLSVALQAVVDASGCFWDVSAGFPGGTDDNAILRTSSLWAAATGGAFIPNPPSTFMAQPLGYVLLGDAAHPLCSWLLKSYPQSGELTTSQRAFNERLTSARTVADAAFLRLRARWQCLCKRNDCAQDVVPTMILACCVLHNVCEAHGDAFVDDWLEAAALAKGPQPAYELPESANEPAGEDVRSLFCQYFLQQQD